jgi:uncharacterized membrane protein
MNKLLAAFVCTALALSLGCNENKSAPGGPGAPGSRSSTAGKDNTFTVTPPSGTTDIKQGHTKEISISVNRGKDFKQNVKLSLSTDATGVTIKPDTAELKASDTATTLKFTIDAAKDAAMGQHTLTVKATPETGQSTESSFKINVTAP